MAQKDQEKIHLNPNDFCDNNDKFSLLSVVGDIIYIRETHIVLYHTCMILFNLQNNSMKYVQLLTHFSNYEIEALNNLTYNHTYIGGKLGFKPMLILLRNPRPPGEVCHIYGLVLRYKSIQKYFWFFSKMNRKI